MSIKRYFTIVGVIATGYGLFFLCAPLLAHDFYNTLGESTNLSFILMRFMGASILTIGCLSFFASVSRRSEATKAILVSVIFFLVLNCLLMAVWTFEGGPTQALYDLVICGSMAMMGIYLLYKKFEPLPPIKI